MIITKDTLMNEIIDIFSDVDSPIDGLLKQLLIMIMKTLGQEKNLLLNFTNV